MFDSHAHYDDERFDEDREELLDAIDSDNFITGIINASVDTSSSEKLIALAATRKKHYVAVGIHPHEAEHVGSGYIEKLRKLALAEKVVAIGEIGLDYHYDFSPRDIQRKVFEEQLILAKELFLPVIIHDREAHQDCIEAVVRYPELRGVFHSFSGSSETANILLKRGWYLSFNGIITFKNAAKPRSVAQIVPDDRLLIETDCPYLSPVPLRGRRNDSRNLRHIATELANLRGQTIEHIEKITTENAKRLFGIK